MLQDNPFAYWRLGEACGDQAYAASWRRFRGTYYNSPTLGVAGAMSDDPDKAITLSFASTNMVKIGTAGALGSLLDSGLTFECFLKSTNTANIQDLLFASGALGSGRYCYIHLNRAVDGTAQSGALRVSLRSSGLDLIGGVDADIGTTDGLWHHLVVTAAPTAEGSRESR